MSLTSYRTAPPRAMEDGIRKPYYPHPFAFSRQGGGDIEQKARNRDRSFEHHATGRGTQTARRHPFRPASAGRWLDHWRGPPAGTSWCDARPNRFKRGKPRQLDGWCASKTWRRPTLPRLETKYHRRRGFSRPSSEWDRVWTPRHGHQVVEAHLLGTPIGHTVRRAARSAHARYACQLGGRRRACRFGNARGVSFCLRASVCLTPNGAGLRCDQANRAIRTG